MADTPVSLLERLRLRPDEESWQRLVAMYAPLVCRWLYARGLRGPDAEDVLQDVLAALVREMAAFEHNGRKGAFRRWLRLVLVNRLRRHWDRRDVDPVATGDSEFHRSLNDLADDASGMSALWNHEHDQHVLRRLLDYIRPEFHPATWQAFQRQVLDGVRPADIAAELNLSVNAVLIAKSRILHRLRQEGRGLID
jgi:RNA polymerase sigma-70 factor (ECF subfamily)